ncbi:MAG: addiction module protein [Deltaproteobacteria bacterium]|nr:addiction module protein [Deltaproteobacteria bacterium]
MLNKKFKDHLLNLSASEMVETIELLSNLLDKPDPEVERLIAQESEKRYKAYKAGKLKAKSLSEVLKSYQ